MDWTCAIYSGSAPGIHKEMKEYFELPFYEKTTRRWLEVSTTIVSENDSSDWSWCYAQKSSVATIERNNDFWLNNN